MRVPISKILFAVTMLAMVSCDEWKVQMVTEVMRDGSCVRTVASDDRSCLTEDEGWESVDEEDYIRKFTADTIYKAVIRRSFEKVEDMNGCPALQICGKSIRSEASLDRKFKWFYTEYTFTETFRGWNADLSIPVTDYVTQDEASFWYTGYPELPKGITGQELQYLQDISFNTDHWIYDMTWDIYFRTIDRFYDEINPPMDRKTFLSMRDSVMHEAWNQDVEFYDNRELEFLDRFFKTDAFTKADFSDEIADYGKILWNQSLGLMHLEAPYMLRMPGRITDAGRGQIEDGVIRYRFEGSFLIPGDYTIAASSRCVNVWAFILSGLVLAVAVGSFFIKR